MLGFFSRLAGVVRDVIVHGIPTVVHKRKISRRWVYVCLHNHGANPCYWLT
jgi:hypothetical protein